MEIKLRALTPDPDYEVDYSLIEREGSVLIRNNNYDREIILFTEHPQKACEGLIKLFNRNPYRFDGFFYDVKNRNLKQISIREFAREIYFK